MMVKKLVTFAGAALLAIGLAGAPALARGGGGFHGGGFHGGGFHGGGFHGGGFHGFHGGGFHGGFAHGGFGHRHFFAGGLGFYDPFYFDGPYGYDDGAYDDCYTRLVRVHGHWARRSYCG